MHTLAYLQFTPRLGDPSGTRADLSPLLEQAKDARLLVLPELANSGYAFSSPEMARRLAEPVPDGPFVEFLSGYATKHQQYIVAGVNELFEGELFNSAVLIGPEGYIGKYQKLHLFLNEWDYFQPGAAGLPVFELEGFRLGILICFDWMFPEVWRILALKGADVIAHPSNLVLPYAQGVVPAYALVNRTFVVTANRTGTEGALTFTGQSIIAGPDGQVLHRATANQTAYGEVQADLQRSRNKRITDRNDVFSDRRPELYSEILSATAPLE